MHRGSSGRPARTRRRSSRLLQSRRGPCRCYGRSYGCFSCNLLANFDAPFDSKQFVETRPLPRNVLDVERAVNLAALAPSTDDPPDPQHPKVPGDTRLAHAKVGGQVVDVLLPNLPEALQDTQARGVGKGQKVVRELVPLAGKKHKACFIRF